MNVLRQLAAIVIGLGASQVAAEDIKLPKQVTPSMRMACEADVRRLCIGGNPTLEGVKSCVREKFLLLGRRCQGELALAGFAR